VLVKDSMKMVDMIMSVMVQNMESGDIRLVKPNPYLHVCEQNES